RSICSTSVAVGLADSVAARQERTAWELALPQGSKRVSYGLWPGTLTSRLQRCHSGAGSFRVAIPEGIDVGIHPPYCRQVEFPVDSFHGANRLTRATIDALIRIDVELTILPGVKMNARHRADAHTRLIHDVNAGCCNHEGHALDLPLGLETPRRSP